ncbi:hypothetical protein ACN47E_005086 [Coniothyrium glycines]
MFRATTRLRECRITFFTRSPCGLCDAAKAVVLKVRSQTPFQYHEVDVMDAGQDQWKSMYEFDTPVIHIDKADAGETTASSLKLMHRFKEQDVLRLMHQAEKA